MPTHNVTITAEMFSLDAQPSSVSVSEGDQLTITNSSGQLIDLMFSGDTIGRLTPMPNGIVPMAIGESLQFETSNLAVKLYDIQLRPRNSTPNPPAPAPQNSNPATHATIQFLSFRAIAATSGGGGIEDGGG